MTTVLTNQLAIDASAPKDRRRLNEPLRQAYVVSGGVNPTDVINGATLDPIREYGTRSGMGHSPVAATIANDLVKHSFAQFDAFSEVVIEPWLSVAGERIGQANASLIGEPIVMVGSIPPENRVGAGVTSLYEDEGLMAKVFRWVGRFVVEQRVRGLLARGDVREARDLLDSSLAEGLDRWRSLLRPPSAIARPTSGDAGSMENSKWLKQNAAEYEGKWVALQDGKLVAAAATRAELTRKLRAENRLAGAFLVCLRN